MRDLPLPRSHGRSRLADPINDEDLLPVKLKPKPTLRRRKDEREDKRTAAYVHPCCVIRSPPATIPAQKWWTSVTEKTHGHPGMAASELDSTSDEFLPYETTFEPWVDYFALYNYRILRASCMRFDDGRTPPYNAVRSTCSFWRGDDRGSVGFCRMVPSLAARAASSANKHKGKKALVLKSHEAALYGAILYRTFNRLSLFSRWAAAKIYAAKRGKKASVADAVRGQAYEDALYGPPGVRDEELHSTASSGVSLLGRHGFRDQWGRDVAEQWLSGERAAVPCAVELPAPSELEDFKAFVRAEVRAGRGVMTGEHQVQERGRVLGMITQLVSRGGLNLKALACKIQNAQNAKTVLDALQELDTVGPFVSWQVFCDVVAAVPVLHPAVVVPHAVVEDSRAGYALFGPGARKGAYLMDGGAVDVIGEDRDTSQPAALGRAKRILEEFPSSLDRMNLRDEWDRLAKGRPYDLETCEHLLCGLYGVVPDMLDKALQNDRLAYEAMGKAAIRAECIWPPERKCCSHSASTSERGATWTPNPCTSLEREELHRKLKGAASFGVKKEE